MKASVSYNYQKISSAFMVFSAIIFAMVDYIFSNNFFDLDFAFFVPISIVSFVMFVFSFGIYSYLRATVLFSDYVKSKNLSSLFSNVVLFINIFTCIAVVIAITYIHFLTFISLN